MSNVVKVTLPSGDVKETTQGTTIAEFIKTSIGAGLAKAALYARYDGKDLDLSAKLQADGKLIDVPGTVATLRIVDWNGDGVPDLLACGMGKAFGGGRAKPRKMTVRESHKILIEEESDKLLDQDAIVKEALEHVFMIAFQKDPQQAIIAMG